MPRHHRYRPADHVLASYSAARCLLGVLIGGQQSAAHAAAAAGTSSCACASSCRFDDPVERDVDAHPVLGTGVEMQPGVPVRGRALSRAPARKAVDGRAVDLGAELASNRVRTPAGDAALSWLA